MDRKVTQPEEEIEAKAHFSKEEVAPSQNSLPVIKASLPEEEVSFEKKASSGMLLAPAPGGWRLIRRGASSAAQRVQARVVYSTLLEAWEAIQPTAGIKQTGFLDILKGERGDEADETLEIAVPARLAIVERLQLPSTEKEELDGMVPLQLEKTLPYPIEEVLYAYAIGKTQVISQPEGDEDGGPLKESTLSLVAIHRPAVEALLAPLLERSVAPKALLLWGDALAAEIGEPVCGIWGEGEEILFGVFEGGAVAFLEAFGAVDELFEALPRLQIGAELAGVSARPAACHVDPVVIDLSTQRSILSQGLAISEQAISVFPFAAVWTRPPLDFTPLAWRQRRAARARKRQLIRKVAIGAVAYGVVLLLAFGVITFRKQQTRRMEAQLVGIRPQLDTLLAHQSRWRALGPAVDTRQFTLELMREVFESLPSPEVRVTLLEQGLGQFKVEVEAPSAAVAIDFGERLKSREALRDYQFEAGQPTLSGSDKAQYRIFGKL